MPCSSPCVDQLSQTRQQEPDYPLLHELARHAIHVSETLGVATQTVKDFQRQYRDFTVAHSQSNSVWRRNHDPFHFPLRVLDGLLSRSESNKARVQNETSLVRSNVSFFLPCNDELTRSPSGISYRFAKGQQNPSPDRRRSTERDHGDEGHCSHHHDLLACYLCLGQLHCDIRRRVAPAS